MGVGMVVFGCGDSGVEVVELDWLLEELDSALTSGMSLVLLALRLLLEPMGFTLLSLMSSSALAPF